jgi:DNA-directed RNA polymerase specialized sigma24 family protein
MDLNARQLAEFVDHFAARCGRPVESLRVTLFRIRAALRKCINDELAINRARS